MGEAVGAAPPPRFFSCSLPLRDRYLCAASVLSGQALAIGGVVVDSCELFDVRHDSWHTLDSLRLKRSRNRSSVVALSDHEVLLVGGLLHPYEQTAEVLRADLRAAGQTPGSAWVVQEHMTLPSASEYVVSVLLNDV